MQHLAHLAGVDRPVEMALRRPRGVVGHDQAGDLPEPLRIPKVPGREGQQLEISEATYHRWRAQYGGLKADDVKRLKELESENARLKRIVADKELQIQALKELGRGNW
jgi:hypothetical protein